MEGPFMCRRPAPSLWRYLLDHISPVVSWTTVRCVFIMPLLMGWQMRSIDFMMAYTQADVKTDIFMQLPTGTTIRGVDPTKHLLKLQKNLYGLKDGQVTWHEHIKAGLLSRGFRQSKVDPCLFIKGTVILVLYVDDAALFSSDSAAINREIDSLKKSFQLTNEGKLQDYLGTCLTKHDDGRIELQQKKTIDNCLDMLGMGPSSKNVKTHDTPAESSKILHADEDGDIRKHAWNYRAVIGCLNYLQAMTRPDLAYSVHQCARFCNNPKLLHKQELKRICRYLYLTRNQGLIFKPDLKDGFKCYVDADWAGNWLKMHPNDKTGALSRTGYIITYTNCPIVWGSKMQSFVALSTTEAELIAMSTALREVIHLQNLLLELHGCNFPIPFMKPQVVCRTFEDNAACIEVATRFAPGPSTFQFVFFIFTTTLKKGSSKLSMSHQNISSPIFLRSLCPGTNTCASVTKLWGGRPLHLLNTRECEVIVGTTFLIVSQLLFPSSLLRAILYSLQYLYSFLPIVRLFYLTRYLHP